VSARHALLVAAQYFLAATATCIAIATAIAPHIDIDIPSTMSPPAVGINVDTRAPSGSITVPTTVDIDTDIGALLSPMCSLITRTRLRSSVAFILRCCRTFSATIAATGIGSLTASVLAASTRSFLVRLLYLQH
jgi:hypothetical protein